jgi:hypothetical protein
MPPVSCGSDGGVLQQLIDPVPLIHELCGGYRAGRRPYNARILYVHRNIDATLAWGS